MYHVSLFSFISGFIAPDSMALELAPVLIRALLLGGLIYCGIYSWNRVKKIIPYLQKAWKFLKASDRFLDKLAEKGDAITNELVGKGDEATRSLAEKGEKATRILAEKGNNYMARFKK